MAFLVKAAPSALGSLKAVHTSPQINSHKNLQGFIFSSSSSSPSFPCPSFPCPSFPLCPLDLLDERRVVLPYATVLAVGACDSCNTNSPSAQSQPTLDIATRHATTGSSGKDIPPLLRQVLASAMWCLY